MADTGPARIFSTSEVASRLGISANTVRRYGLAWEEVQGETLPHLPGMGRLYPADVVEMLEQAQDWLNAHPERDIEEALQQVLGLEAKAPAPAAAPTPQDLSALVQEAVRQAVTPLLHELSHVKAQLAAIERAQQLFLSQLEAEAAVTAMPESHPEPARAAPEQPEQPERQAAEAGAASEAGVAKPRRAAPLDTPTNAPPKPLPQPPLETLPQGLIIETRPEADVGPVRELPLHDQEAPGRQPEGRDQALDPGTLDPDTQNPDPLADVWLEEEPTEEEVIFDDTPEMALEEELAEELAEEPGQVRGDRQQDGNEDKRGFIGWFKRNF